MKPDAWCIPSMYGKTDIKKNNNNIKILGRCSKDIYFKNTSQRRRNECVKSNRKYLNIPIIIESITTEKL